MTAFSMDVHLPPDFAAQALARDALAGLTSTPKSLPPKWFYDKVGSELFEDITRLREYYPTRAEREILQSRSGDIAAAGGCDVLLELGSGSSIKTRLLIDAMRAHGGLRSYVALDVSEAALQDAGMSLAADYPDLAVHGLVADFEHQLDLLPAGGRRLVAFLGSTIGNFEPASRAAFLRSLRAGAAGFEIAAGGPPAIGAFLTELQHTYPYGRSGLEGPQAVFGRLYQWLEFGAENPAYDPVRAVVVNAGRRHVLPWGHVTNVRQGLSIMFDLDAGKSVQAWGAPAPRRPGIIAGAIDRRTSPTHDLHHDADILYGVRRAASPSPEAVASTWDIIPLVIGAVLVVAVVVEFAIKA